VFYISENSLFLLAVWIIRKKAFRISHHWSWNFFVIERRCREQNETLYWRKSYSCLFLSKTQFKSEEFIECCQPSIIKKKFMNLSNHFFSLKIKRLSKSFHFSTEFQFIQVNFCFNNRSHNAISTFLGLSFALFQASKVSETELFPYRNCFTKYKEVRFRGFLVVFEKTSISKGL